MITKIVFEKPVCRSMGILPMSRRAILALQFVAFHGRDARATSRHFSTGRRGFTLAESLMAVVVLGIAAAGVLLPFSGGARVRAEGDRRTLAVKLASDLTEQIVNTPFDQIIATYDGYSESQGQVRDADGAVFADGHYANFSRDAGCQYVYVPQESGGDDPIFIRATVRVYYSGRTVATVNRLISK